jgi:hypothetical protein
LPPPNLFFAVLQPQGELPLTPFGTGEASVALKHAPNGHIEDGSPNSHSLRSSDKDAANRQTREDGREAEINGITYTYSPARTTWELAQQECEAAGGNLVAFETELEEQAVMRELSINMGEGYWIGCNKRHCEFGRLVLVSSLFVPPHTR